VNAIHQPEIVATQRGSGSAEVTVRAILTTAYLGTCEQHNRPVRADLREDIGPRAMVPCPDGDHEIPARRLTIVQSNVTCDGSCWAAFHDRCICGCGGLNHGRSWALSSAFATMSDEALAEAWRGARLSTREVFEDKLEAWRTARAQAAQAKSDRREKRKATKQRRAQVTFSEWAASHANVIEALRPWRGSEDNCFLADLALQVTDGRNGIPKPLSDAQVGAARDAIMRERRRERIAAEREAARRPVPTGRTQITGRIVKVSYRTRDGHGDLYRWGSQHHMTVSCDGYAVRVPVPAAVDRWARENRREVLNRGCKPNDFDETIAERWTDALRGAQVTLTTTISRSDRDSSFGFGKGASGARVIAGPEPEAVPEADREAEAL
jgi:hypothetical protein